MSTRDNTTGPPSDAPLSVDELQCIDAACLEFERRCRNGDEPRIEEFLTDLPRAARTELVCELVALQADYRRARGVPIDADDLLRRFPDEGDRIREMLAPIEARPANANQSQSTQDFVAKTRSTADPTRTSHPEVPGYEIFGELGRGGMGVVYRARQKSPSRLVALKVILSGPHSAPAQFDRLRAEADAAAMLRHPHVVQVYDVGTHAGLPYIAMEYVGGGDLKKLLGRQPLPPQFSAQLLVTLAETMQYCHSRGVVHRDLKPANVLLEAALLPTAGSGHTTTGAPPFAKITDFGLAIQTEQFDLASDQTVPESSAATIAGTPAYMAPEQAAGQSASAGPPADVYALGAILYEMLTGKPPFAGRTPAETMRQVLDEPPVPPSRIERNVPRDLETVCLKCLQKRPERRYRSAGELAEDARRFLVGEPVSARRVGRFERIGRWIRRRPLAAGLIAASILIFTVGAAAVWSLTTRLERERDAATDRVAELERELDRLKSAADERDAR